MKILIIKGFSVLTPTTLFSPPNFLFLSPPQPSLIPSPPKNWAPLSNFNKINYLI